MQFCPECGSRQESGQVFCKSCGSRLPGSAPEPAGSLPPAPAGSRGAPHWTSRTRAGQPAPRALPSIPRPLAAGVLIALLLVAGIAAFFVFFGPSFPGSAQNATTSSSSSAPDAGIPPVNGQCSGGMSLCSGACVNLQTDQNNCGKCSFPVPFGETCVNGKFSSSLPRSTATTAPGSAGTNAATAGSSAACPSGQTSCTGTCRNLQTDTAHCGACGNSCTSGQSCQNGRCSSGTAVPTASAKIPATLVVDLGCSGRETACGNSCVDLLSDKKNCGVCGRTCGAQEICLGARCGPACTGDKTLCGDTCTDLDTDMNNCGTCGTECETFLPNAKGSLCMGGECVLSGCKTDYGDCDKTLANGCEIYLRTNAANCGSCGTKCATGKVCYNKKCSDPISK
jgi:hypothetical protein